MALVLSGCASYDTAQDQRGIEVNGYHIVKTDKKLVKCHDPGTSGWGGSGNDFFYYPAGQHTFSFTGNSSEVEEDPIPVVTQDGQTLTQPGFIKFTLTSNCQDLYLFHTQVGLKYQAYTKQGLANLEKDYLGVAVNNALNDAVGQFGWQSYYEDASIRNKVEQSALPEMQAAVNQSLGNSDWIKVNSVTLSKPQIPKALAEGLENIQAAQLNQQAQQQQNAVNQSKYTSIKQCLDDGIDAETCRIVYLALNDDIPFYPIPQGGSVVVQGGANSGN